MYVCVGLDGWVGILGVCGEVPKDGTKGVFVCVGLVGLLPGWEGILGVCGEVPNDGTKGVFVGLLGWEGYRGLDGDVWIDGIEGVIVCEGLGGK